MKPQPHLAFVAAITMLSLGAASYNAFAVDASAASGLQARYDQERAACIAGRTHQDRATCLQEAGAAFDAAKRGPLTDASADYRKNALQRCNNLPDKDRADCRARIDGDATVVTGDPLTGGTLSERVTREPAAAKASPAASAASAP